MKPLGAGVVGVAPSSLRNPTFSISRGCSLPRRIVDLDRWREIAALLAGQVDRPYLRQRASWIAVDRCGGAATPSHASGARAATPRVAQRRVRAGGESAGARAGPGGESEPSTSDYVAAFAAAWVVFSRTVLLGQERREQDAGALAQEVFDVDVFGLPWNAAKAGPAPAPEDLCNWGERQAETEVRDWYPDVRPVQYPLDVLLCQRASVTWARQDHATYAQILRSCVGVALVLTVALGLILGLDLSEYLLRLGLPVLPAALDVLDIASANTGLARSRGQLQLEADSLYARARETGRPPSMHQCRGLQDEIHATRRVLGVPNSFYRLTRERRQRNMQDVAREQAQRLPAVLR